MSIECKNVTWSDSYLLGDSTIDEEHKQLFNLTEKLFNCQNDQNEVMGVLKELIKYTKFHFAHEEQFMKSIDFQYLEQHKSLHESIVKKLTSYIELKNSMEPKEFAQKLALFVKENIVHHILTEDKRVHHFRRDTNELKALFNWKDQYKINHDKIDKEHQVLFQLALKVLDIPQENKKEYIKKILVELTEYMQEHFSNEEQYMSYIGFPDFTRHQELHENIIKQMNDFIKSLPKLTIDQFERKLIEYMDVWIINHIITEDHNIVCYQNSTKES